MTSAGHFPPPADLERVRSISGHNPLSPRSCVTHFPLPQPPHPTHHIGPYHNPRWSFPTPSRYRVRTLNIRFWGVKTPPPFVLWIPAPTTPTTISTPSHALPPHPTPPDFHHRSILNPRARVSGFGAKAPAPTRSLDPRLRLSSHYTSSIPY